MRAARSRPVHDQDRRGDRAWGAFSCDPRACWHRLDAADVGSQGASELEQGGAELEQVADRRGDATTYPDTTVPPDDAGGTGETSAPAVVA